MVDGNPSANSAEPVIPAQHPTTGPQKESSTKIVVGVVAAVVIFLIIIVGGVWLLLLPTTDTPRVRDIFIIFMALESLLIGVTLVILIIQIARLINLLQNEIKPILDTTNETVANLRGTTTFLSDNLVQPVIKLNTYMAGFSQAARVIGLSRRKPKN